MMLSGKSAVITGGGSGIGAAVAVALADAGANVLIAGRDAAKLEAVAVGCERISAFACDVSDRTRANALIAAAEKRFGQIDILVNAAGVNVPKRLMTDLDPAEWDRLLAINATGTFNAIHAVLPGMRRRRDGLIVNVNSMSGLRAGMLGGVAYNAGKFAVTALTHSVAQEVKDEGIRLTNLCPGEVDTPILAARPTPVTAEHRGRMLQPEDVAAAVLMIATLPPRANIVELVIKPTTQPYV